MLWLLCLLGAGLLRPGQMDRPSGLPRPSSLTQSCPREGVSCDTSPQSHPAFPLNPPVPVRQAKGVRVTSTTGKRPAQ